MKNEIIYCALITLSLFSNFTSLMCILKLCNSNGVKQTSNSRDLGLSKWPKPELVGKFPIYFALDVFFGGM